MLYDSQAYSRYLKFASKNKCVQVKFGNKNSLFIYLFILFLSLLLSIKAYGTSECGILSWVGAYYHFFLVC